MVELRPNIEFHGCEFVRHLGICNQICVKLLQVMSGVIPRNLKKRRVYLKPFSWGPQTRHTHTYTQTHTDTHRHTQKTHIPLDIVMENVYPRFNFDFWITIYLCFQTNSNLLFWSTLCDWHIQLLFSCEHKHNLISSLRNTINSQILPAW